MPTLIDQTTVVTLPTVPLGTQPTSVDQGLNNITATVIVSAADTTTGFAIKGPDIKIKGPGQGQSPEQITVLWSFVTDISTGLSVTGVSVTFDPTGNHDISVGLDEPGPESHQRQTVINLDAITPTTSFNYHVNLDGPKLSHDPTIVVVPEPIGG